MSGVYKQSIVWQLVFALFIFIIQVFDKKHVHVHMSDIAFFLNYLVASLFISHWLLPRYLYKKKYLTFALWIIVILAGVIVIEEFVLEKIYFPHSRGEYFRGIGYTLLDVLPVIVLLVGFKFAYDAHFRTLELEQLERTFTKGQLQFLKSQINPHFLFNNLNNLYSFALENSPQTPDIILQLSSLMRYTVYGSKEEKVSLEKEVTFLKDFISLQKLQIENRGEVSFEVEGVLVGKYIAPLLLIAIVENSFKHSTSSQVDGIYINISVRLNDHKLTLDCSNTFSEVQNNELLSTGVGLENLKKRLALIYPERHRLEIEKKKDVFRVQLEIELNKEES